MKDQLRYDEVKKTSTISIIINVSLTIVKAIVGVLSGSTALIADAFHSASDLFATIVLLQGLKIAHKPADEDHPYGHHRAETITAKFLAIILIVTGLGIGLASYKILRQPVVRVPEIMAAYIAILSIVSKEWLYRYTIKIGNKINSSAVIADAWHHRSDAFSSIAALIGIVGARFGYPIMDPLVGILVAILILKTGVSIYKQAIIDLMDTAPPKQILNEIRKIALQAQGIKEVQDVKMRQYGSKFMVDMKVCVDPSITVKEGHDAAAGAKKNIMESGHDIQDVLIHVNPCKQPNSENCQKCDSQYKP